LFKFPILTEKSCAFECFEWALLWALLWAFERRF
jgi:hypothetical protein